MKRNATPLQPPEPLGTESDQLNGWKEIAAYAGRSAQTVQRRERERAFPVHRLAGGALEAAFARKSEIDAWKGLAAGWETDASSDEADARE